MTASILKGAAAGIAGAAAMNLLQSRSHGAQSVKVDERGKDPAEKTAEAAGARDPNRTGITLHYAFGAAAGALYGTLPPMMKAGFGIPYGVGVWLAADRIAVPALGLADRRAQRNTRAFTLFSHALYGAVMAGAYGLLSKDRVY